MSEVGGFLRGRTEPKRAQPVSVLPNPRNTVKDRRAGTRGHACARGRRTAADGPPCIHRSYATGETPIRQSPRVGYLLDSSRPISGTPSHTALPPVSFDPTASVARAPRAVTPDALRATALRPGHGAVHPGGQGGGRRRGRWARISPIPNEFGRGGKGLPRLPVGRPLPSPGGRRMSAQHADVAGSIWITRA